MDWKSARLWSLCFLVLCPVVLGKENTGKESQDSTDESKEVPQLSESKVFFVAKDKSKIAAFREDSSNVSNINSSSKEKTETFQIETPVIRKKARRVLKSRRNGKTLKAQNTTADELNTQSSKQSAVSVPNADESQRTEETRQSKSALSSESESNLNKNDDDNDVSSTETKFSPTHFVPSQDFPKKLASHSRQDSSKERTSVPVGSGEIRYVLSLDPDSSEETGISDISTERFESKRRKNPSSSFNSRPFSIDIARQPLEEDFKQSHQSNQFPPAEAQKVTIVKEKTIHSTSREQAQERVNIEKNPRHIQSANEGLLQHQEPRTFHSSEDFGSVAPQNTNNQEEKIILIEGTRIPGRNYGPEDDTFGFHANSYKEEKQPLQPTNRRRVKVIKVLKSKPDGTAPIGTPLNIHGDGQSQQYFVSDQQNVHSNQELNNQFASNEQTLLGNVPQIQQNGEPHFIPNHANSNAKQTTNVPVQQNFNFHDALPQNNLHAGNNDGNNFPANQEDNQHVILNITPDPNEIYIDEDTGQLIKFVISDDSNESPDSNFDGRRFNNEKSTQNAFSQTFPEPQINIGEHQKGTSQLPQHNTGANTFGRQGLSDHSATNGYGNQQNQQEEIRYIQVPNNGNNAGSQEVYHFPSSETSGNQYTQEIGISDTKDNSEEYIILCDQKAQDFSAEYQSGDLGSIKSGLNSGTNNYQQSNFPNQNQFQNSGINHNKGQQFVPDNQGGYGLNSGNQNQNYGSNQIKSTGQSQASIYLHNQGNSGNQGQYKGSTNFPSPQTNLGAQGHYKGSEFSNNKGVTNFATPQTNAGAQGHYKGTDFSSNKGNTNYEIPQISGGSDYGNSKGVTNFATPQTNVVAQGHYKGSEFSNNKGSTNFQIPQINSGNQGQYKGSDYSNNKGVTNFATPQTSVSTQGHYKGNTNFGNSQINAGAQGHYKGSEFSGGQGQYGNNKGTTNFATPQLNINAQGQYKGSDFSNNKGGTNFDISQYSNNKGSNFAIPQTNIGGQSQYKGSGFSNNKGSTNFPTPQINIGSQGQYKGSISNTKHNSKTPVYREVVTPSYPVGNDLTSSKGNNKGANFYIPQNQGNFAQGGPSPGNYNKGPSFPNQKGYNAGNNAFSNNNKGYGGSNNKGVQMANLKGYVDSNAFSNQKYGGDANLFSGIGNNKGLQNQKGYGGGNQFSGITLQGGQNKGSQFPTQMGYNKGNQISNNKGYDSGQNLFSGIKGQNKGSRPNQKGYNAGNGVFSGAIPTQGINKGNQFPSSKGSGGLYNNQGPNLGALNKGLVNQKGYSTGSGQMNFGNQKGYNTGSGQMNFGNQKGYNTGSGQMNFGNQKGYNTGSGQTNFGNQKGYNTGSGQANFGNQKGYNTGSGQMNFGNQKGYNTGSGQMNFGNQKGYNTGSGQTNFGNQKGYNTGSGQANFGNQKGYNTGSVLMNLGNQKGYNANNRGLSNNQNNFGGKGYEQGISLGKGGINPGTTSQKGYNKGNNLFSGAGLSNAHSNSPQISGQKGYTVGNDAFSNNQGYNLEDQFLDSLSLKGDQDDLALLIQKGYNAESDIFSTNKAHDLFSGTLGSSNPKKGSGFSSQKGYMPGKSTGNLGYNAGIELFSDAISSKGLNQGLGYPSSKGLNVGNNQLSGNQGYQKPTVSTSYSGSSSPKGPSKGSNYNSGSNTGKQGYKGGSDPFSNKGYQAGTSQYTDNSGEQFKGIPIQISQNSGEQFKGTPIQISQNSGYQKQVDNAIAAHNNFKGTNFNKNSGTSDYGSQNAAGYGTQNAAAGYGTQNAAAGYGTQNAAAGYGNQNAATGYGNQNPAAGYGTQNAAAGYGTQNAAAGYGNQNAAAGYGNQNTAAGYGTQNAAAGYGSQNAAGYGNQNAAEGYGSQNAAGYGNQNAAGYGTQNSASFGGGTASKTQEYNSGNDQYGGISYTSNEDTTYQPGQQHSENQGPVQYIIVEEDMPGQKNGNDQAVYYLQYENNDQSKPGQNQEQTYLLLDDSSIQQNQNYRVMVDGGKDRTFPIRQLATVGLHMAKSVLPQMQRSKAKSISGKISFGVEIKKGADESSESQKYLQSRSDNDDQEIQESSQTDNPKLITANSQIESPRSIVTDKQTEKVQT